MQVTMSYWASHWDKTEKDQLLAAQKLFGIGKTALCQNAHPVHVVSDFGILVPLNRASAFCTTTFDAGMNLWECSLADASARANGFSFSSGQHQVSIAMKHWLHVVYEQQDTHLLVNICWAVQDKGRQVICKCTRLSINHIQRQRWTWNIRKFQGTNLSPQCCPESLAGWAVCTC